MRTALAPQVAGGAGRKCAGSDEPAAGVGAGVTHLQVPVHHPHLVAVQHGLQDLLDAVTAGREEGAGLRAGLPREAPGGRAPPAAAAQGCTSHSPGIRLTVILPGHDVFKQLPAGDAGETGRESPSHRGPRCRVSRKLRMGRRDLRTSAPKGGAPEATGMPPDITPFLTSSPPSPPCSAFSSTRARLRSGLGVGHSEHVTMIHQALGNPRAGAFCCCFLIDFFKE